MSSVAAGVGVPLALLDAHQIVDVPALALEGPLDVVAGFAALLLVAGPITAPAGVCVCSLGVSVRVFLVRINVFVDTNPVFLRDLVESVLQVFLVEEGPWNRAITLIYTVWQSGTKSQSRRQSRQINRSSYNCGQLYSDPIYQPLRQ